MIQELIILSQSVAHDTSAIQEAGGNASVKNNDIMYVKASGTLLSKISHDKGWAKVDLQNWRKDFNDFSSDNEDEFVKINIANTLDGGRASIETGLHALLPHRYVLHTHSVYANVLLCGGETHKFCEFIQKNHDVNIVVVPMCAPGLQLTTHLTRELAKVDNHKPIIVLLENHGIALSCNDLEQTIALHDFLHNSARDFFQLPKFENFSLTERDSVTKLPNSNAFISEEKFWSTDFTDSNVNIDFFNDPLVFFPDQVVYVNNKLNKNISIRYNLSATFIEENCLVFSNLTEPKARNTAEILASVLYLYQNIKNPHTLPQELCEYIANMSGEKYRQSLEL